MAPGKFISCQYLVAYDWKLTYDMLQVLCNGAMATQLALLYLLDVGSADLPVDFRHQYRASWLGMGVLGAVACCNGDTWASELGSVISKADPFLITTFQKVPKVMK